MPKTRDLRSIDQPYISPAGASIISVTGGITGPITPHDLNNTTLHLGLLDRAQAPWVETDIDTNIANHAALPDVHHDRVTAGNTAILVSTQAVSVALAANSGLAVASGLTLGPPGQVSATSTAAVSGSTHNHDVLAHSDLKTNPGHLVKADGSGFVEFSKVTTDTLSADGILTVNPTTQVNIQAGKALHTSDSVTGLFGAGYRLTNVAGHGFLDIREIQVEELRAYLFMADFVRVQIGEDFITESMGVMYADMTTPSIGSIATLIVEDVPFFSGALFADNDYVMIALIDRSGGGLTIARAWGQVSTYVDLGADANGIKRQSWTYTHRSGDVGLLYKAGSVVMGWGQSGASYIHSSVVDGGGSPYTRYASWVTNPYTPANRTVHTQVGNLDGLPDDPEGLEPAGFGLYGTNVFLKGNFYAADGDVRILDGEGINIAVGATEAVFDALALQWWQNITDRTGNPALNMYTYTVGIAGPDAFHTAGSITSFGKSGGYSTVELVARGSVDASTAGRIFVTSPRTDTGGEIRSQIGLQANSVLVGRNLAGAEIFLQAPDTKTFHVKPFTDNLYDLGTAALRYRAIYVDQLNAGTIAGATLSGAEWEFPGSMTIDANAATDTLVSVVNQGAGRVDLSVDRDITVGGLVDGVDVATLGGSYTAHIANANAHHDTATAGDGIALTGQSIAVNSTVVRTTRTLTAGDGLDGGGDLSANRSFAVDTTVVRTSRLLTAGAGLTGGGTLSADRTFTVGAGDGIAVAADAVAVDLATNSGLLFATAKLALGTPTQLSAASTNAVTTDTHAHSVDATGNPDTAVSLLKTLTGGSLRLGSTLLYIDNTTKNVWVNGTPDGSAALSVQVVNNSDVSMRIKQKSGQTGRMWKVENAAGAELIVLDSEGNLQSGNPGFVSGLTGWQITHTGNAEFNNAWIRGELHASIFVVDEFHSSGGTLVISPSGKLENDATITFGGIADDLEAVTTSGTFSGTVIDAATTSGTFSGTVLQIATIQNYIDITDPPAGHALVFSPGDILRVKTLMMGTGVDLWDIWLRVNSASDQTDYWRYYVDRTSGGMDGLVIPAGSAVISYGQAGDGRILLTADQNTAPYLDVFTTETSPWAGGITPRIRLGRLDGVGLPGISGIEQYGMVASTDLSDANAAYFVASNLQIKLHKIDLTLSNGANPTVELTSAGRVRFGTDVEAESTTGFEFDPASGNLRVGQFANNYLYWDQTTGLLSLKGSMEITAATGWTNITDRPTTLSALDSTASIKLGTIETGATVGATWGINITSQPTALSGINSGEGTKLSGIEAGATLGAAWGTNLTGRPTELTDGRIAAGLNASGFVITKVLPGSNVGTPVGAGLFLGADKMGYYSGSAWRTYMNSSGQFFFAGTGAGAIAWDLTDLYGTDGTTVQWYARASTGKLNAGAGAVWLDALGIGLNAYVTVSEAVNPDGNSVRWYYGSDKVGSIGVQRISSFSDFQTTISAYTPSGSGYDAVVKLQAASAAGGASGELTVHNANGVSITQGDFLVSTDSLFVDISAARVGINTGSPAAALDVRAGSSEAGLRIQTTSASQSLFDLDIVKQDYWQFSKFDVYSSASALHCPSFIVRRARDTEASPDAVASGDAVGLFGFRAYDGAAFQQRAYIQAAVDAAVSGGTVPMALIFATGGAAAAEAARISSGGSMSIGGVAAPLGKLHVAQASTTATIPTLELQQADLSEEFINFVSTIGAGNPIEVDTTVPASSTHKIRIALNGSTLGYLYVYGS